MMDLRDLPTLGWLAEGLCAIEQDVRILHLRDLPPFKLLVEGRCALWQPRQGSQNPHRQKHNPLWGVWGYLFPESPFCGF